MFLVYCISYAKNILLSAGACPGIRKGEGGGGQNLKLFFLLFNLFFLAQPRK